MTSPSAWARVQVVFDAARQLPAAERAGYLDHACAGDPGLQREIESLLLSLEAAGSFMQVPAALPSPLAADPAIGLRLGPWRLVAEIGRGGMGAVYRATRDDEQYHQDVAVKLLPAGIAGEAVTARLRAERQILARLDHPNIARLLDGGSAPDGRPYLVMELVAGQPIDDYCDGQNLTTRARLEIFASVCDAVQYAHQNLVVHRDLKPGNILVTADATPKLLDFGIAKLLGDDLGAARTVTELRALTPRYASPEQVEGGPVTTASDIYSLGVLLYELMAGRSPYELQTLTPEQLLFAVLQQEPERPSRAARRQGANGPRTTSPGSHVTASTARELEGDLDWIVLTALRKEPARRYASARDLGEDIRRHLAGFPVRARPDTLRYRVSKFVRRHRVGVGATALLFLSLAAGLAMSLWQWRRAEAARREASQRFDDTRRLAGTLLFEVNDAIQDLPGSTKARALIVKRGVEYLDRLAASSVDDEVKAELAAGYLQLAEVQGGQNANLGDTTAALESYRKAVRLAEAAGAAPGASMARRVLLARAYRRLAGAYRDRGEAKAADELMSRAAGILEAMVERNPGDRRLTASLAAARFDEGQARSGATDWTGALAAYGRSAELYEKLAAAEPTKLDPQRNVALTYKYMGGALERLERFEEARRRYEQAVAIDRRLVAADPNNAPARLDLSFDLASLAKLDGKQGRVDRAISGLREALGLRDAVLAADPANAQARAAVARARSDLAEFLARSGEWRLAEAEMRRSLADRERLAAGKPASLSPTFDLALALVGLGDLVAGAQPFQDPLPAALLRGRRAAEACVLYARSRSLLLPLAGRTPRDWEFLPQRISQRSAACDGRGHR